MVKRQLNKIEVVGGQKLILGGEYPSTKLVAKYCKQINDRYMSVENTSFGQDSLKIQPKIA